MTDFYADTLSTLLKSDEIKLDDSILVTCGGKVDRDALLSLDFKNVTITNVDKQFAPNVFVPYSWDFQNAECLTYGDSSFEFVISHSGLHHCRSPHRALLEMYRVARKGILVFEPRDSFLLRLGVKLGFGQDYELAAVIGNEERCGGVTNSVIPNYVYRWTKREVEKTIRSYAPETRHRLEYFYALRIPTGALSQKRRKLHLYIANMLGRFAGLASAFPFMANNIAFFVAKAQLPRDLQPWLRSRGTELEFTGRVENTSTSPT
jgi:ubiquinone/menaquinone biosynthesis C-methylase UbiE